jgi:hypothetical protein
VRQNNVWSSVIRFSKNQFKLYPIKKPKASKVFAKFAGRKRPGETARGKRITGSDADGAVLGFEEWLAIVKS